ncbi:pre-toxin TG domain-containing protein [Priestia endophytica]|uniref:pre-toxin TG domain-containing protein n=2 Tax=Priestia endophytica TaxID=135735 RepID=UPI001F5BAFE9|nr:pre-toxin TG domain-containing protein [Priestia endophytica]
MGGSYALSGQSEELGETVQHIQKTAQGLKEMDMVMNSILMPSNIVLHALSKVGFDVTSKRFISYQGRITPATGQLMARYKKGELYSYDTLFPKSKNVKVKAKNNYETEILEAVKSHKVPSPDALRWGMGLAQDKHIKDPMKRQFIDTNLTNGQAASFAFDFIPFLGSAKAADEARTGKQYFTGKKLDTSDRAIAAASVLGGGFVKWTGKGAKVILKGKPLSEQTHLKWNKKTGEVKQHTPKKTKGTSNIKYKEGYYIEHLTGDVKKCTPRHGVSGGHNYDEFKKYFNHSDKFKLEEVNKIEHPSFKGVYDIEYRLKVEIKDYRGQGTGEFKLEPKEGKPSLKKTVYDPTIISDDEIVRLGEEAMEEGLKSSRVKYLEKQGKEKIQGVSSTGLKFEGFRDINTGEITNFYPILK